MAESRRAKKMTEAVKVAKFIEKVSDPGLIEYLHMEMLESVEEMVRMTKSHCRGEEVAKNLLQQRKPSPEK